MSKVILIDVAVTGTVGILDDDGDVIQKMPLKMELPVKMPDEALAEVPAAIRNQIDSLQTQVDQADESTKEKKK